MGSGGGGLAAAGGMCGGAADNAGGSAAASRPSTAAVVAALPSRVLGLDPTKVRYLMRVLDEIEEMERQGVEVSEYRTGAKLKARASVRLWLG